MGRIYKINRGDSFSFDLTLPTDKNTRLLAIDEVVYFALMYPHQPIEDAIILRGYTHDDQDVKTGAITIKLSPSDTRHLLPGVYYYTVKLQKGGTPGIIGDYDEPVEVCTIIERTKFIVNE